MNIYAMLPFLSKKDVDAYLDKIISGEIKNVALAAFLPFASKSKLDEVFASEYKKGNLKGKQLSQFFPFVSQSALHNVVMDYCSGNGSTIPSSIVPFLSSEDVSALFEYKLQHPEQESESDSGFDVSDLTDMATEIAKTAMGGIGKAFGGIKVTVGNDDEDDEDDVDDAIEDFEDAVEEVESALEELSNILGNDKIASKLSPEKREKLEKMKRKLADKLNK